MATSTVWPTRQLKEITSTIGSGATPRGGKNVYKLEGTSLIRSLNVHDFSFSETDLAFIDGKQAGELDNVTVQKDDILLNITGASVARCCMVNPKHLPARVNQHVAIVRVCPSEAEAKFVFYTINSPHHKSRLLALAQGGATREALTKKTIKEFDIPLPPLSIQRRIAGILSAYDELIENNQRRIRILETMARALYREWFVEFRFPGHGRLPRVASPLGDIPQGWETKPLGEVAHIFRGRSYRSVDLAGEGGLPFLNLKCIDRDGGFRRSGLKRYTGEYRDTHIAKKGDIVVAVTDMTQERRIVARAALVPTLKREFGVYSMDLVRVEPRPPMPGEFLYAFLRYSSFGDEVKQHANGVNVLHLAPKRIAEFQLVVPPIDLIRQFTGVSAPTLGQMDTLESQIENLRCTRDLLLPRLLSGQVTLTDAAV